MGGEQAQMSVKCGGRRALGGGTHHLDQEVPAAPAQHVVRPRDGSQRCLLPPPFLRNRLGVEHTHVGRDKHEPTTPANEGVSMTLGPLPQLGPPFNSTTAGLTVF